MSKETSKWLNQYVLIGMTSQRGTAWHYRASDQGVEPNHYAGAIPIEDVRRRLFNWTAESAEIKGFPGMNRDGLPKAGQTISADEYQMVYRSDTLDVLGIHKSSYSIHQYDAWLLGHLGNILDDGLVISSAGLLKKGGIAWVEVSVPETFILANVTFRPNLLAVTSHNGSYASTYKRTITNTVCDNTMAGALSERGDEIRIRHTRRSTLNVIDARHTLEIIHKNADDFIQYLDRMLQIPVTDTQFGRVIDKTFTPELPVLRSSYPDSAYASKKAKLWTLWDNDERVSPWRNTAWGVIQAFNTYRTHEMGKPAARPERNAQRMLTGYYDTLDSYTFDTLQSVLQ